ncbi:MAG: hypothetical protein RRC34_15865, partial [Lentisphaeria bacterium]|nr:hypothetical protein [Lentisphaeria bacterium]
IPCSSVHHSQVSRERPSGDAGPNKTKLAPSVGRTSKSGLAGEGTPAYSKFQESGSAVSANFAPNPADAGKLKPDKVRDNVFS